MDRWLNEQIQILDIPNDIGYWLVRADGGKYYEDFFHNNFIAVSDNEVTLEMIKECAKYSIAGITIDHYKELYVEIYSKWTKQQIAQAARRTQKFLDKIKKGDLVLVPSKNSTHFLIGIIASDVYEIPEKDIKSREPVHYAINPFLKRRKVRWVKEVPRGEISEKLYWMLSAHQTIFDLQEHRDYINQLLAPIYIQDGICHGMIKIDKKSGLNTNEWYDFYSLVKKISVDSRKEVVVKSNVQSPGIVEIVTSYSNVTTIVTLIVVLSGILFTKVRIGNFEILGLIPYFFNEGKLQRKKMKQENKTLEIDNNIKQIELEEKKIELEKKKLELEAIKIKEQLQISSFDAGKKLSNRTQTDIFEIPNADEPEKP